MKRILAGSLAVLALCSCGPQPTACDVVQNAVYKSTTNGECGQRLDGTISSCPWTITFHRTEWSRTGSDYLEGGTYACNGNTITLAGSFTRTANYEPKTGLISAFGLTFARDHEL